MAPVFLTGGMTHDSRSAKTRRRLLHRRHSDSEAVAQCFTDDAVVKDEGHTYRRSVPRSRSGRRKPRPSISTRASLSRANEQDGKVIVTLPTHRQLSRQPRQSSVLLRTRRRQDRRRWKSSRELALRRRRPTQMFAVYATHAAPDDSALSPEDRGAARTRTCPTDWVRVKVSHASLNRHDLFTLRGISGHPEGITYPIILGNDAAGTLDDGTPVVIYPMMGSDDWRGDETLDPNGTFPASSSTALSPTTPSCPRRNAIPLPRSAFAPSCLSPGHGLADRLPRPVHQVRTSSRRDGVDSGGHRRHGDCTDSTRLAPPASRSGQPVARRKVGLRPHALGAAPDLSSQLRLCHERCRPSSITSARTPGRTACRRSPAAARWSSLAAQQGSKCR